MKPRKVYVLVGLDGDWVAQCVEKDKISSHSPDYHMEIWTYEGIMITNKEKVKEN